MTRRLVMSGALIASLFLSLFVSNNTSAMSDWTYITNPSEGYRGFTNVWSGSPQYNNGASWLEATQMPSVIIGRTPSPYWVTYLNGVTYGKSGLSVGNSSNKYNYIEMVVRFQQAVESNGIQKSWTTSITPHMHYATSSGKNDFVACSKYAEDALALEWNCSVATDDYSSIIAISFDWGNWSYVNANTGTAIAYICADKNTSISAFDWNTEGCNTNSLVFATWRYRFETSQDPTPAILSGLNNTLNNVNNNIININNTIEDHWNEEKQEENEREQQGQQDANDLSGLFNFNVINPLNALYSAVSANTQCVNIPTIASMLNVQDTQYCNWFPQSVRSILTPVISLTSMMLVFGYLVSWLRQSSSPTVDIIERK